MTSFGKTFGRVAALGVLAFGLVGFAGPAAATHIQRVVSPSGLEAWLVEDHAVPIVAVDFSFLGGSTQDAPGKEGAVNLITALMDEGAGDLDSQSFQKKLEDLSIDLSFSDDLDRFNGEMKTLSENRDAAFALLALSLSRPRFDKDAVERMKVQMVASIRRAERDPESVAARLWSKSVFPDHPYGRGARGTETSVNAITQADLRDLHSRIFTRKGLKIAVVGDIDAATLAASLDRVFGALPAEGRLTPVADIVPKTGVSVHAGLDVPQAAIFFGGPGIARNDPDFIPAYVAVHILGGSSFSSWLHKEVREKRGLAYTILVGLSPRPHGNALIGTVGTSADKVDEVIGLVRAAMKRMHDQGPSAEELAAAKAHLIGSYALRFDTSDKIAGALLGIQIDDLGIDYIDRRNALFEAVTLDDVKRVAGRLFAAEPSFAVAGPDGAAKSPAGQPPTK